MAFKNQSIVTCYFPYWLPLVELPYKLICLAFFIVETFLNYIRGIHVQDFSASSHTHYFIKKCVCDTLLTSTYELMLV